MLLLRATKKQLLLVAAVVLLSMSLSGCAAIARARHSYHMSTAEQSMFRRINTYRRAHGLASLGTSMVANKKARFWAALMANGGCGRDASGVPRICHSNLASGITIAWSRLGENVGMVSPRTNIAGMEGAFENSPPHAENMRSNVRYLGVGVAYWSNYMYVAEVFVGT
ncbi:MAG TPA: CAP domain-containing protein [Acidimicrobiia bacterium]|nr:CAP domain-containing protein [Acidimicrobiia bacterium]